MRRHGNGSAGYPRSRFVFWKRPSPQPQGSSRPLLVDEPDKPRRLAWWPGCLIGLVLAGCMLDKVPNRDLDFQNARDVVDAYHDYLRLEKADVEMVNVSHHAFNQKISLQLYLYLLAQAFEQFGKEENAKKVYFRLLIQYPLLTEGGQLGVMAENRLRWILGDKQWIKPSVDELIMDLESALRDRDAEALGQLLSRDFGFGRNENERFAVRYQEAREMLTADLRTLDHPLVEIISKVENEKVILRTLGWDHGRKVWYFTLRKNDRMQGWECDLAYWEKKQ